MRRLIVNADDFGRAPGVSRGIIEAHRAGIVSSTTLMVNQRWSRDAAQLAEADPALGVGLHLNFCYGEPLAQVPSLTSADGLLERDLERLRTNALVEDIEAEARAQLERFRKLTGRNPTHLDSHQHIHAWPEMRGVIAQIAHENELPLRAIDDEH
ncbi:MAG: ChbG/HpnK family deacetylase, partial [Thermomicrobiales bacterium]|nr:ChbG/HpnK family deacetylase [Thermomicrobiales bacterium]